MGLGYTKIASVIKRAQFNAFYKITDTIFSLLYFNTQEKASDFIMHLSIYSSFVRLYQSPTCGCDDLMEKFLYIYRPCLFFVYIIKYVYKSHDVEVKGWCLAIAHTKTELAIRTMMMMTRKNYQVLTSNRLCIYNNNKCIE